MICQVDKNGYCQRHKTRHVGRMLELALMDNELGEKYRRHWDGANTPSNATATKLSEQPGLGDQVATALAKVGITKERVEKWVGGPCGCKERQEKLNALGSWARGVLSGTIHKAKESLERLTGT